MAKVRKYITRIGVLFIESNVATKMDKSLIEAVREYHAPSNRQPLPSCYRKHENLKKRAYEQRVREVEHGSFIPLVFSLTGGMGNSASVCYKRLASLISAKRDTSYSSTLAWIRCSLSFSLLRSSIQCIRGARSAAGRAAKQPIPPVDLVSSEARLSTSC